MGREVGAGVLMYGATGLGTELGRIGSDHLHLLTHLDMGGPFWFLSACLLPLPGWQFPFLFLIFKWACYGRNESVSRLVGRQAGGF
ncbi:hypothetical protein F5Y14DRAFT_398736 [Nemania sp. NC0429]|nr:hypothetical protein F5Y14DRAFT_398736 [Nemania sp. NC0429]